MKSSLTIFSTSSWLLFITTSKTISTILPWITRSRCATLIWSSNLTIYPWTARKINPTRASRYDFRSYENKVCIMPKTVVYLYLFGSYENHRSFLTPLHYDLWVNIVQSQVQNVPFHIQNLLFIVSFETHLDSLTQKLLFLFINWFFKTNVIIFQKFFRAIS